MGDHIWSHHWKMKTLLLLVFSITLLALTVSGSEQEEESSLVRNVREPGKLTEQNGKQIGKKKEIKKPHRKGKQRSLKKKENKKPHKKGKQRRLKKNENKKPHKRKTKKI